MGGGSGRSLYDRLGGSPAVHAVANGLVDRILMDARVNKWFAHAASSPDNTAAYKSQAVRFRLSGHRRSLPVSGRDMVAAHRGRAVTGEAFDAVVEDLVAVLRTLKVPEKEKGELLQLLGPLKTSIVQK